MTARVLLLPCVLCCMPVSKYISDGGRLMQVLRVVEVTRVLTWKFYLERILPVGLFMALTLLFGNVVYLYLTVSFIQMLKASSSKPFPCQ